MPIIVIKPQDLLAVPDVDTPPTAAAAARGELPPPAGAQTGGGAAASMAGGESAAGAAAGGADPGGLLPPHTLSLGPLALAPGQEQRRFVAVPPGATWGELVVRGGAYDTPKLFLIRWELLSAARPC